MKCELAWELVMRDSPERKSIRFDAANQLSGAAFPITKKPICLFETILLNSPQAQFCSKAATMLMSDDTIKEVLVLVLVQ